MAIVAFVSSAVGRRAGQCPRWRWAPVPCYTAEVGRPSLTIMTFNVGNGLAEPDRLVDVLRRVNADVVGLQELSAHQAHALTTGLQDVYPYQVLIPDGLAGKGMLSCFQLISHEQLALYSDRPDLA